MRRHPAWLCGFGILAAIAAASSGKAAPDDVAAKKPAPPGGAAAATVPLSEAECRDYARSVAEAFASGDPAALNKLIDWDTILEPMVAGLEISDSFRASVLKGMRKQLDDPEAGLSGQLIKIVKNNGKFAFVHMRQSRGRPVALFRMISPGAQSGLNYYEFTPRRYPGGEVRASDIYVYSSGEFVSEICRRTMLPIIADKSRSTRDKLNAGERDYVHDFMDVGRAVTLTGQGKPADALAIYKKLRPGTRKQKVVLLNHLRAAQGFGDEKEYAAVIEEFRKNYPDDPGLDLISIDGYIIRRDFDAAIKALDRVDQAVGGDPYLNLIRAGICESRGDREAARRFVRRAVEHDPTLLQGHWALVGYSLTAEDYKETLERLKEIDRGFTMVFSDLTKVPLYAGFVKSPEYREWLDYLKNKKPAAAKAADRPASKPATPRPTKPGPNG